jgi:hypothetical protein
LSFDGTDDFISSSPSSLTGVVTVALNCELLAIPATTGYFISQTSSSGLVGQDYALAVGALGTTRFIVARDGTARIVAGPTITAPTNLFMVGIDDGTNLRLYVNGAESILTNGGGRATSSVGAKTYVGRAFGTGQATACRIRSAAVFPKVISTNDIMRILQQ